MPRVSAIPAALLLAVFVAPAAVVSAQDAPSRAALIEEAEKTKSEQLRPSTPDKAEAYVERISDALLSGQLHWHAFWQNAYSGGGFTLGAGYLTHVSPYNTLDVRGSITRYEPDLPVAYTGTTVAQGQPDSIDVTKRLVQITVSVQILDQHRGKTLWQANGLTLEGDYAPGSETEKDGREKALDKLVTNIVDGAQSQW